MPLHAQYTQFIAYPGQGKELIAILMKANNIVSRAKGCRQYIINEDADNKDIIWVTELWDSEEEQIISQSMDGCRELATEAGLVLAAPPKQIALKAITGKGLEVEMV